VAKIETTLTLVEMVGTCWERAESEAVRRRKMSASFIVEPTFNGDFLGFGQRGYLEKL
jgi:hypothetical protein